MKYLDIRKSIKTGDIFSCVGTAFYSKIIKIWTGDLITHTGIAIWVKFPQDELPDRLCILEAHAFKGVQLHLLSNVLTQNYWKYGGQVYWQKITDPKIEGNAVASFALNNWSKSYATLYQFIIAGSRIVQIIRHLTNRPLNIHPDRFHCSELATRSLIDAGFCYDRDPAITTPGEVSRFRCLDEKVLLEPSNNSKSGNTVIWRPAINSEIRDTK